MQMSRRASSNKFPSCLNINRRSINEPFEWKRLHVVATQLLPSPMAPPSLAIGILAIARECLCDPQISSQVHWEAPRLENNCSSRPAHLIWVMNNGNKCHCCEMEREKHQNRFAAFNSNLNAYLEAASNSLIFLEGSAHPRRRRNSLICFNATLMLSPTLPLVARHCSCPLASLLACLHLTSFVLAARGVALEWCSRLDSLPIVLALDQRSSSTRYVGD